MSRSHHLVLTVDYELFGNGSGDVDCCVIEPAKRMLKVAERFNAPLTFFVEVLEFSILSQLEDFKGPVGRLRNQLTESVKNGHDAQLHLHPQWLKDKYSNKGFTIDFDRWRISDLDEREILDLISFGKRWLEELLTPVSRLYSCNTFRAGGWCIQPSEKVVKGLVKNGFKIDSTVAPGSRNTSKTEWYDYRKVPSLPAWKVDSDVCNKANSGIYEAPITTGSVGRWRHLQAIKSNRSRTNGGLSPNCRGSYQRPREKMQEVIGKACKLLDSGHVMLDFSTMPASILIEVSKQWIDRFSCSDGIPLVAIAHTKNFTHSSEESLCTYLEWSRRNNITFSTYGQWLEALDE